MTLASSGWPAPARMRRDSPFPWLTLLEQVVQSGRCREWPSCGIRTRCVLCLSCVFPTHGGSQHWAAEFLMAPFSRTFLPKEDINLAQISLLALAPRVYRPGVLFCPLSLEFQLVLSQCRETILVARLPGVYEQSTPCLVLDLLKFWTGQDVLRRRLSNRYFVRMLPWNMKFFTCMRKMPFVIILTLGQTALVLCALLLCLCIFIFAFCPFVSMHPYRHPYPVKFCISTSWNFVLLLNWKHQVWTLFCILFCVLDCKTRSKEKKVYTNVPLESIICR